jgi:hypothetical protein
MGIALGQNGARSAVDLLRACNVGMKRALSAGQILPACTIRAANFGVIAALASNASNPALFTGADLQHSHRRVVPICSVLANERKESYR